MDNALLTFSGVGNCDLMLPPKTPTYIVEAKLAETIGARDVPTIRDRYIGVRDVASLRQGKYNG